MVKLKPIKPSTKTPCSVIILAFTSLVNVDVQISWITTALYLFRQDLTLQWGSKYSCAKISKEVQMANKISKTIRILVFNWLKQDGSILNSYVVQFLNTWYSVPHYIINKGTYNGDLKYGTSLVFEWSKNARLPNGQVFECHLSIRLNLSGIQTTI